MGFTCHNNSTAAAPFLLVNVSGPCRPLLRAAHMVGRILFSVGLMAVLAYCLGGAGSRTAGVRTVSVLCGIIILHITIGVEALMPMMRRIVLPCLIPAVTARLNRLVFFNAAFVAGKYSVALRQAGRRYGHLSIVPNMRVLLVPCITAGAFLPMGVPVMMPIRMRRNRAPKPRLCRRRPSRQRDPCRRAARCCRSGRTPSISPSPWHSQASASYNQTLSSR